MRDQHADAAQRRRNICAILFDLDGVLVNTGYNIGVHWERWAIRRGLSPADVIGYAHGRRTRDTVSYFAKDVDVAEEADLIEAAQLADSHDTRVIPGASELLPSLRPGRYGIVTSGGFKLATGLLNVSGLPVPEVLVTAEDVERGKPYPDAYLLGAERLGFPSEAVVVVEDAPAGIEAAFSAGMDVVALTTTHPADELGAATMIVPGLTELKSAIADYYGETSQNIFKAKADG